MVAINYDEIEEKCVDFVKYFNSIGLETAMCCEGHNKRSMFKYWVSFTANVKDEDIRAFVNSMPRPFYAIRDGVQVVGRFIKIDFGLFDDGSDRARWRYESGVFDNYIQNQVVAERDLAYFKKYKPAPVK